MITGPRRRLPSKVGSKQKVQAPCWLVTLQLTVQKPHRPIVLESTGGASNPPQKVDIGVPLPRTLASLECGAQRGAGGQVR
jgi:hypothetical protein